MTPLRPGLTLALLLTACTLRAPPGGDAEGTTTGSTTGATSEDPDTGTPTSTGEPDPTTTTSTTADPDTTAEPCGFAGCETFGTTSSEPLTCDGYKQLEPECAAGQKCTIDGDISETHCVDIVREPKGLYEPCTVVGEAQSGIDDCGPALVCWDVNEQGRGTCLGLCDDTDGALNCVDPGATCTTCQECALGICFPRCNPLLHECDPGQVCIPVTNSAGDFFCVIDASGDEGQVHDPCEYPNACDDGLFCLFSGSAIECDPNVSGCCQPFCDLTLPNPCTGAGQICSPAHEEGQAPPGLENLGICMLPR